MLILREFSSFDDPGNEKLSRQLYTEKTVLMSHWFRCVRLPHHVTEPEHPFSCLYQGEDPPQLMMTDGSGTRIEAFAYGSSRADLSSEMDRILKDYYVKSPSKAVDELVKLLPKFDTLDVDIQDLKEALDKVIEGAGPRSGKARKLQKELARAEAKRKALEEKKESLRDIPLKDRDRNRP